MHRVSWIENKSNEDILRTTNDKEEIMCKMRKREAECVVHVMGKRTLERIVTTVNAKVKKQRWAKN